MNANPNQIESTNENKKPIRPKTSSNKFNLNNISKLIQYFFNLSKYITSRIILQYINRSKNPLITIKIN